MFFDAFDKFADPWVWNLDFFHQQDTENSVPDKEPEPKNNEGRKTCWWCGKDTEKIQGLTEVYDFCRPCGV